MPPYTYTCRYYKTYQFLVCLLKVNKQRSIYLRVVSCMGPTGLNSSSVVKRAATVTSYVVFRRRPVTTADVESPLYWISNSDLKHIHVFFFLYCMYNFHIHVPCVLFKSIGAQSYQFSCFLKSNLW